MSDLGNDNTVLGKMRGIGLQRFLAPVALVIIYVFFGIFGRNFFSFGTLVNILDSSYYIGFIAIGVWTLYGHFTTSA